MLYLLMILINGSYDPNIDMAVFKTMEACETQAPDLIGKYMKNSHVSFKCLAVADLTGWH